MQQPPEWTVERIASALNVLKGTISEDLQEVVSKETTHRPKGGRPKGFVQAKPAFDLGI
jgi:hypothetical protein